MTGSRRSTTTQTPTKRCSPSPSPRTPRTLHATRTPCLTLRWRPMQMISLFLVRGAPERPRSMIIMITTMPRLQARLLTPRRRPQPSRRFVSFLLLPRWLKLRRRLRRRRLRLRRDRIAIHMMTGRCTALRPPGVNMGDAGQERFWDEKQRWARVDSRRYTYPSTFHQLYPSTRLCIQ